MISNVNRKKRGKMKKGENVNEKIDEHNKYSFDIFQLQMQTCPNVTRFKRKPD